MLIFVLIVTVRVNSFSQSKELEGKWILDKVVYKSGETLEINNELYAKELVYSIKPKELQINEQKFAAQFTNTKIKTAFRHLTYAIENNYLKIIDPSLDRIEYFLKAADFVEKYPEFKMKEVVTGQDTLFIANIATDYAFNNQVNFDDFIHRNMPIWESKKYNNLYFKIEFILTKDSKIKEIKILNSISTEYDNNYVAALKKAEPFFKNNTQKNILIVVEKQYVQFYKDMKDPNEVMLFDIIIRADALYDDNKFEEAIREYNQIKQIPFKNNHYKYHRNEAMIHLGICYLATGDPSKACENFKLVGDITDFSVRNYLLNFCKE
jgi:tetratricopeptide (TPR) repeat protein